MDKGYLHSYATILLKRLQEEPLVSVLGFSSYSWILLYKV